jgi:membrane protease YdiL (CAAX protease family)
MFIALSLISAAVLYKLVTGDTTKVIGQAELQKAPWIVTVSFVLFWVIAPVIWRIFVEKEIFNKIFLSFGSKSIFSWFMAIVGSIVLGLIASLGDSQSSTNPSKSLLFVILNLLLIAITEEFIFRFFIAGRIAKIGGVVLAVLLSSLLFTFYHLQAPVENLIPYLIFVFCTGAYLSFLFFRFKSIWICIFAHWTINFISLMIPFQNLFK